MVDFPEPAPDDAKHGTGRDREGDASSAGTLVPAIGERHIVEADRAVEAVAACRRRRPRPSGGRFSTEAAWPIEAATSS